DRDALAHDPLEPFAHLLQHRVASLLPEAIVDALEAVDVADDHDSAPARDIRLFHHAREGALKRLAVWESRDAVVFDVPLDLIGETVVVECNPREARQSCETPTDDLVQLAGRIALGPVRHD